MCRPYETFGKGFSLVVLESQERAKNVTYSISYIRKVNGGLTSLSIKRTHFCCILLTVETSCFGFYPPTDPRVSRSTEFGL